MFLLKSLKVPAPRPAPLSGPQSSSHPRPTDPGQQPDRGTCRAKDHQERGSEPANKSASHELLPSAPQFIPVPFCAVNDLAGMPPYSLPGPSRSWQPPRRSAKTVASRAIAATLQLRILMDELLCSRYQNNYAASRFFFQARLVAGATGIYV